MNAKQLKPRHTIGTIGLSILAASIAVVLAEPAAADQDEFLRKLREKYGFLTPEQVITTGHKICAATHSGTTSANTIATVSDYLGISIAAAVDIVSLANVELGC